MKKIIFFLSFFCFHAQLWGQEQVTNFENSRVLHFGGPIYTENRVWFNVSINYTNSAIFVTDGSVKNTMLFNLDGLNILPQSVIDVVEFENYYYLLVEAELGRYLIRTSYQNSKWSSEIIVKLSKNENVRLKKIDKRVFLIHRNSLRISEINGLQVAELEYQKPLSFNGTLEDIVVLPNGNFICFFDDKKRFGLSIRITKHEKVEEIFLKNQYLRDPHPVFEPCSHKYQIVVSQNVLNLYTGYAFFQINTDSVTYKEPLKGAYVSAFLETKDNIYVSSFDSTSKSGTFRIVKFNKLAEKQSEFKNLPFSVTKIFSVPDDFILFIQDCSRIGKYDIKSESYTSDWFVYQSNQLYYKNKLYFSDSELGNVFCENGEKKKLESFRGNFKEIYSLKQDEKLFSLKISNDSLILSENPLDENVIVSKLTFTQLVEKSSWVNPIPISNRTLVTNDGQYQNDKNLEFFDGKNIVPVKYEDGNLVSTISFNQILKFNNQYFIITKLGLFELKKDLAVGIIKKDLQGGQFWLSQTSNFFSFYILDGFYSGHDLWVSDGTKNGTMVANPAYFALSEKIGVFQNKLLYIKDNKLYSFDGKSEKLISTLGKYNEYLHNVTDNEHTFYFFNNGVNGLEVSKLMSNENVENVFTLQEFKGQKEVYVSKISVPNVFLLTQYINQNYINYILKIDLQSNNYSLTKVDSTYYVNTVNFEKYNRGDYINIQKELIPWTQNDIRDIFSNNIIKIDKDNRYKSIFQFNTKQPNYESVKLVTLNNKVLVFINSGKNIWQIDTTTDIATQFIYEKDNLRFHKIIDGKLYLNLCKDGQCHLYRTDGSNKNTYQLTQNPLAVQDMFVLNNELYLYASNTKVGFQIWKISKDDERKVDNLFTEKVEPTPNLNFVILSNEEEKIEQITVFPNPFTEKIDLLINKSSFKCVEVFGINGVKLFESNQDFEISVEELNKFLEQSMSSIFYLKVKTNNGFTVKKIFKQ